MASAGTGTPSYSSAWIPISVDNYAGTCIFLIAIGVILRSLVAVKSVVTRRGIDAELNTRYVVVKKKANSEWIGSDSASSKGVLPETGLETDVILVRRRVEGARPWRITIDGPRAAIDAVIAGLLYLTMLSIMPMNVGYFLSVLGGIFLGSLAVGRYGGWTPGDTSLQDDTTKCHGPFGDQTGSFEYEVDKKSWNGYAYECYLFHRTFDRLFSLNQHVNSPTQTIIKLHTFVPETATSW